MRRLALFLMGSSCACAMAGPTSLYQIPIADYLRHREALTYLCASGYERRVDRKTYWAASLNVGALDRIELGGDTDFEGWSAAHLKVGLAEGDWGGISAGVTNIRGEDFEPFVAARLDFDRFRAHLGYWEKESVDRFYAGVDFDLAHGLSGSIEHIAGSGGETWAALNVEVSGIEGLGVQLAFGIPNRRSDGLQYGATVYYGFSL